MEMPQAPDDGGLRSYRSEEEPSVKGLTWNDLLATRDFHGPLNLENPEFYCGTSRITGPLAAGGPAGPWGVVAVPGCFAGASVR